jgi:hypothetical protein
MAIGGEFLVNTFFTSGQFAGDGGMAGDGAFVVAWQSQGNDGNGYGIFGQTFDSNGGATGTEFQVNKYTSTVDGNGTPDPLTDGLLFLRYLFGFTGTTLTDGATAMNCSRCDAATIIPYLDGLV